MEAFVWTFQEHSSFYFRSVTAACCVSLAPMPLYFAVLRSAPPSVAMAEPPCAVHPPMKSGCVCCCIRCSCTLPCMAATCSRSFRCRWTFIWECSFVCFAAPAKWRRRRARRRWCLCAAAAAPSTCSRSASPTRSAKECNIRAEALRLGRLAASAAATSTSPAQSGRIRCTTRVLWRVCWRRWGVLEREDLLNIFSLFRTYSIFSAHRFAPLRKRAKWNQPCRWKQPGASLECWVLLPRSSPTRLCSTDRITWPRSCIVMCLARSSSGERLRSTRRLCLKS